MKLRPLGNRLIVRAIEEEETTESGIVLPDSTKDKPHKGKVLAVGEGSINEETGRRSPLDVAEGDEVLYSQYGGTEIKIDGEELLVLREADLVAVVGSRGKAPVDLPDDLLDSTSGSEVAGLRRGVEDDIKRLQELAR